jgi:hypothetical protein
MQNVAATLEGVVVFGGEHPLTPANTRATALYTQIGTTATSLRAHADDQDSGNAEFRSGTLSRREASKALRDEMRPINQMARALPKDQFPGVRALFRMPPTTGYAAILSRANAFLEAVGPIKAAFVERGLPADFDEQLETRIAAITAATNSRTLGKAEQVGGTAGMGAKASEGLAAVAELDSILSYQYRNNPALLAAWKSVRHVQRDPVREAEEPAAPVETLALNVESPVTAGVSSATTVALNGHESTSGGVEPRINGTNGVLVA